MQEHHDPDRSTMSIDQVIEEAVRREESIQEYYRGALELAGPDAQSILSRLYFEENERIETLRSLLGEIRELRELSTPMVG